MYTDTDSGIQPRATTYPNQLQNMLTEPLKARFLSCFVSALLSSLLALMQPFQGLFHALGSFFFPSSELVEKQAPQAGFPRRQAARLAQTKHF
jgi:hypothetical protein